MHTIADVPISFLLSPIVNQYKRIEIKYLKCDYFSKTLRGIVAIITRNTAYSYYSVYLNKGYRMALLQLV